MMRGNGFLAIWSDVADEQLTDYLHWLTREHTTERLGVEGFIAVRVFRSVLSSANRFLIIYELEEPAALSGQPYLDRLNNPSPWSQRIMPILGNFIRGGGYRRVSKGVGCGGVIAALTKTVPQTWTEDLTDRIAREDRIAIVHVLETDRDKTSIQTDEKRLRGGDKSFDTLLLVEGLDEAAVRAALIQSGISSGDDSPLYTLMFSLDGRRWT